MKRFVTAFLWRFLLFFLLISWLIGEIPFNWLALIADSPIRIAVRALVVGAGVFLMEYLTMRTMPKAKIAACKHPALCICLTGIIAIAAEYCLILSGMNTYLYLGISSLFWGNVKTYLSMSPAEREMSEFSIVGKWITAVGISMVGSLILFFALSPVLLYTYRKKFSGNSTEVSHETPYLCRFLLQFLPRFMLMEAAAAVVALVVGMAAGKILDIQTESKYMIMFLAQYLLGAAAILFALHFSYQKLYKINVFPKYPRIFLMTFVVVLWFALAIIAMNITVQIAMCNVVNELMHLGGAPLNIVHAASVLGCFTEIAIVLIGTWMLTARYEDDLLWNH